MKTDESPLSHAELLESAIANSPATIYVIDRSMTFLLSEGRLLKQLGLKAGEVVGKKVGEVFNTAPHIIPPIEQALAREEVHVAVELGELSYDVQYTPIFRDGKVSHIIGIAIDNRATKAAEAALATSENKFRSIIEHSPMGMHQYTLDAVDRLVFSGYNPAANRILGVDCAMFMGKPIEEAFPPLAETEVPLRYRLAAREGQYWKSDQVMYDGDRIQGAFQVHAFQIQPGAMCALFLDVSDYLLQQQEIRDLNESLERKVQERTRELEDNLHSLQAAEKELAQSENMSSLGRLVAGVAHEVNTPLGISLTDVSYLLEQLRQLDKLFSSGNMKKSDLETFIARMNQTGSSLESNLNRAASLVASFKSVAADRSSQQRRTFEISQAINDLLASLHNRIKLTRVEVQVECQPGLILDNYPGAFSQCLAILIINSLTHAFEPGSPGHIIIRATRRPDGADLHYADDGCGVPEDQIHRIFEPFFTTKRNKGGTGLGLSILWNIIHQTMSGTLDYASQPGQGLSLDFHIPNLPPAQSG